MVKCRELLELDVFHNVRLLAGRDGLDRNVKWVYAKHTKSLVPWVNGGELVMVSGYEHGITVDDLLNLIVEAAENQVAGVFVEGGINFKELPDEVIKLADHHSMPLFFVKGVVSFLEVTQDILELIMESKKAQTRDFSVLDELQKPSNRNRTEVERILRSAGLSVDSKYMVFVFAIANQYDDGKSSMKDKADWNKKLIKRIGKKVFNVFDDYGIVETKKITLDTIEYLIYADDSKELMEIAKKIEDVHKIIDLDEDKAMVYLCSSGLIESGQGIAEGLEKAYFTLHLRKSGVFRRKYLSFEDIGSYQLMHYVRDYEKLKVFRNDYLKEIYEIDKDGTSELLKSLREFLAQGGNVLQTSKNLFIHRNTLLYRIKKIQEITGRNLENHKVRQDFINAFMILDVMPFEQ